MASPVLFATLLALTVIGFYLGRSRAIATAGREKRRLHSLSSYYGYYVAIWCGLPSLLVLVLWLALAPEILRWLLIEHLPAAARELSPDRLGLLLNDVRNLASGNVVGQTADPELQARAERKHRRGTDDANLITGLGAARPYDGR